MKDTDSFKKLQDRIEHSVRNLCEERPLGCVATAFGAGLALGLTEEALTRTAGFGLETVAKDLAQKMVQTHGNSLINKIFEGALGSLLIRAGLDILNEHFRKGHASGTHMHHPHKSKWVN